jgi:hypothetical protein
MYDMLMYIQLLNSVFLEITCNELVNLKYYFFEGINKCRRGLFLRIGDLAERNGNNITWRSPALRFEGYPLAILAVYD